MKKDKNPNDNLGIILIGLAVILIGTLVGSYVFTEHRLNQTYTTKPTMETRGVDDNYIPSKPRFKITFEPLEEDN